jgi:hypothetical protein
LVSRGTINSLSSEHPVFYYTTGDDINTMNVHGTCSPCLFNTLVSNYVNSDHVPYFSCLDVWNVKQITSGVYPMTVTTSKYNSRRCGIL